jgi:predicted phosphoribosyltransferase
MDAILRQATRFHDRRDAGRRLADDPRLRPYQGRGDVIVLALPRGGVPVAYELAEALGLPLDVFVVRKLGVPGHEELAMGAIASGGTSVLDERLVTSLGLDQETIARVAGEQQRKLEEGEHRYRQGRPAPEVAGKTVLLVDDGLATGSTMLAAVSAVRGLEPARVVVAVPVAPASALDALRRVADAVVCPRVPANFLAVGLAYANFDQLSDQDVRQLLSSSSGPRRDP